MKRLLVKERSPVRSSATVRHVLPGKIVGFVSENGAHVWRGIPFAASTAGDNRWRAPQPPAPWEGTRECLHFAERCAQLTNEFDADEGLEPGLVVGSEDCLALDVYAPADAEGSALPVMVWIHPGGNVWGRSSAYDGSSLAQNEDVVVVAVQYRLGPLGWFANESLREAAGTPHDGSACFATLDLIASLGWVRENIDAFGGDPSNVTIFGESAGGHNVVTLLASPLAEGLFHRAIVQSGAFESVSLAEAEGREGDLLNPSAKIGERLGATNADALRAVSVESLLGAYTRGRGFLDVPRVIRDGVVLPTSPLIDAFRSTQTFNAVPIVLGTNREEMKLFYVGDERLTRKRFGFLVVARDQGRFDALTEYLTRMWRVRAVVEPAQAMTAAGHLSVYAYRFDWDDGGRLLSMDFKELFGAAHGFDLPFVFNRFEHLGDADRFLFQKKTRQDRERLSRAMGAYWASFARNGVPSGSGLPKWPRYGEAGGSFLRLDTDNDGGIETVCGPDSLDAIVADLRNDVRIDRCDVVGEMERWMFSRPIHEQVKAAVAGIGAFSHRLV